MLVNLSKEKDIRIGKHKVFNYCLGETNSRTIGKNLPFSFVEYDLEEGKALTYLSEQTLWLYKCNSLSLNIKHDL